MNRIESKIRLKKCIKKTTKILKKRVRVDFSQIIKIYKGTTVIITMSY